MQGLKSYNCLSKFSCVSVYAIFVKMLLIMKFNGKYAICVDIAPCTNNFVLRTR